MLIKTNKSFLNTLSVVFPTRIIDLKVTPNPAIAGEPATISGVLQHEVFPGIWLGLANAPVNIYINGQFIGTVTTNGDGSFELIHTFTGPGVYTISAYYPGSQWDNPAGPVSTTVTVITQQQAQLNQFLIGLVIAIVIALGGALIYELVT